MNVVGRMSSVKSASCGKGGGATSSIKTQLLGTTSLVAIIICLAGSPTKAVAQDQSGKLIIEFSGSSYSGDKQPWNQFGPNDFNTIGPGLGLNGLFGYVGPAGRFLPFADNGWNIGVFARFGSSNKDTEAGYGSPYFNILGGAFATAYSAGKATHREEHLIVDFEARRDVGLGSQENTHTTLLAGIRFAHFNADTDTEFYAPSYFLQEKRRFEFTGIGPKIGAEHIQPINPFVSFDLSASAAFLYGRRSTTVTAIGCACGINNSTSAERSDWVPMLEGRLGFTVSSPNSPISLSMGVEANAWFGLYDQRAVRAVAGASVPGNENANRFSFGPYVRLTTLLGGSPGDTAAFAKNDYDSSSAMLDRQSILELGIWGGHLWRFGNALNSSGDPRTEIEDFSLGGLEFLAALPFAGNWLVQFEGQGEATFDNNRLGSMFADDTYGGGHQIGGHLAVVTDNTLFGIFGGTGRTEINDNHKDSLDSEFEFGGLEGRFLSTNGSIAVQAGFLNSTAIDDDESLDDAAFARIIGQLFFNGGKTLVQGNLGYAEGLQDSDDDITNNAKLFSWGGQFEHQLPMNIGTASTSLFASFEGVRVEEASTGGGIDRVEESTLLAGLKIRFGAATPYQRAFNSAPDLPNVMRWMGAVPAVD